MPDEIIRDNILSASAIYFAAQFEQMRLFATADRIVELFVHGLLPLGSGSAGRALDNYYWTRFSRLTPGDRRGLYGRVLGIPGGDAGTEAQPNTEFNELWLRFVAAVAEFGRVRQTPAATESMEAVRKAGHDLAVNLSLHGYGYAYFAARRLKADIAAALAILKQPEIQAAYGARSPYQVIERVSTTELSGPVNIVRYRTLAEAGKNILDTVARYSGKWGGTSGRPLFRDASAGGTKVPDISDSDRDTVLNSVQQWLAVTGAPDDPGPANQ
jgi:hypothetical protein